MESLKKSAGKYPQWVSLLEKKVKMLIEIFQTNQKTLNQTAKAALKKNMLDVMNEIVVLLEFDNFGGREDNFNTKQFKASR